MWWVKVNNLPKKAVMKFFGLTSIFPPKRTILLCDKSTILNCFKPRMSCNENSSSLLCVKLRYLKDLNGSKEPFRAVSWLNPIWRSSRFSCSKKSWGDSCKNHGKFSLFITSSTHKGENKRHSYARKSHAILRQIGEVMKK